MNREGESLATRVLRCRAPIQVSEGNNGIDMCLCDSGNSWGGQNRRYVFPGAKRAIGSAPVHQRLFKEQFFIAVSQ